MQQSEIILVDSQFSSENAKKSLEDLVRIFFNEENEDKKEEIYRKIQTKIITCENINSIEINKTIKDCFDKITEPNKFDKKLIKLFLASGWRVPQDFQENELLNIIEKSNNFFSQDLKIKIQDYKKIYANSSIKIEKKFKKEFWESLKSSFEYFEYCRDPRNEEDVDVKKKNMLRVNINGIILGFSAFGFYYFLKNLKIEENERELNFLQFVDVDNFKSRKLKFFLKNAFASLECHCIADKLILQDSELAKKSVENHLDSRASIEYLKKRDSQDLTKNSSFEKGFMRANSDEKNKIVNGENPHCCSFLKVIFYKFFNLKPQQNEEKQTPLEISLKPDMARNPSSVVCANSFAQPHYNFRDDIMLER